jgi:hypothetical protein
MDLPPHHFERLPGLLQSVLALPSGCLAVFRGQVGVGEPELVDVLEDVVVEVPL